MNIFLVTKFRPSPPDKLSEALDKGLKRLCTDYVDVFFTHGISDFSQIEGTRDWSAQMKKSGKIKFFGFSTHTNMEDRLLAAAKSGWIDSIMFTYNFRLMNAAKMKEAVDACAQAGIGLTSFKTQAGGQIKADSETEFKLVQKFLERGFTDKQSKLKAVWENPKDHPRSSQRHPVGKIRRRTPDPPNAEAPAQAQPARGPTVGRGPSTPGRPAHPGRLLAPIEPYRLLEGWHGRSLPGKVP